MTSKDDLRKRLTERQWKVTQEDDTEPPFDNEYWDEWREGVYVDIVTGEPLFGSWEKYDAGCGWPSFHTPLKDESIAEKADYKYANRPRVEVRSKNSDAHLGHVFTDGPGPKGLRYCINSAAVKFIPKEELEEAGLGDWLRYFPS